MVEHALVLDREQYVQAERSDDDALIFTLKWVKNQVDNKQRLGAELQDNYRSRIHGRGIMKRVMELVKMEATLVLIMKKGNLKYINGLLDSNYYYFDYYFSIRSQQVID